jgi:Putative collagen-binding domain of a collagenase
MENELAPTYGDLVLPPPPILEDLRRAMGHTLKQAKRMNLAAMTPQNALAQSAYCLANPGVEYLAYAPSAGTFWVDLSSGLGRTFVVEWLNPRTGAVLAGASVAGGSSRHSFTAPVNDDGAVLYLKSTD